MCCAGVDSGVGSGDFLQNQTLIRNYDFFLDVMGQFPTIVPPSDFIGLRIGSDRAFKIDIVTFLDIGSIQIAAKTQS